MHHSGVYSSISIFKMIHILIHLINERNSSQFRVTFQAAIDLHLFPHGMKIYYQALETCLSCIIHHYEHFVS